MTCNPDLLFDVEYIGNDIRYGHNYNGMPCDVSNVVISNDLE